MKPHFVYKPKIKPLPRTLILDTKSRNQDFYKMITTKDPRVVGIMFAEQKKIDCKKYFHIAFLYIKEQRKGFGKEFIEFAKNRSRQLNCDGRIFLTAESNVMDAKRPPHIFYRKQGFTSNDKKSLKIIDSFIKEKKEMENNDIMPLYMYYDPNKRSLWQKFKDYFRISF